jgi:hypothetical protein
MLVKGAMGLFFCRSKKAAIPTHHPSPKQGTTFHPLDESQGLSSPTFVTPFSLSSREQFRCASGKCLLKTSTAEKFPEMLEMHKLSGSHCSLLKVAVASMRHLEAFNERLGAHGALVVSIVISSALTHRVIDWEQLDVEVDPPVDPGWRRVENRKGRVVSENVSQSTSRFSSGR